MPLTGTYVQNTPQGNQQINHTQNPIKTNFYDIQDLFSVNHGPLKTDGDPSLNEGLHTLVSYLTQQEDPETGSNDMAMYAKNVAGDTNLMELFVRYPDNGTVVQLTGTSTGTSSGSTTTTTSLSSSSGAIFYDNINGGYYGYQYLGGGIVTIFGLQFLSITSSALQTSSLTFPTFSGFDGFSATPFHMEISHSNDAYSDQLQAPYGEIYVTPTSSTTYDITYTISPVSVGSTVYYWMAIGAS